MSLPTIRLFIGYDRTVRILGPGVSSFDHDTYSESKLVCTALGIEKSTTDSAEAVLANSGADIDVHFLAADLGSVPKEVSYGLFVKSGTKWFPASEVPGKLVIQPAP